MASEPSCSGTVDGVREEQLRIIEREVSIWREKKAKYERQLQDLLDGGGSPSAVKGMIDSVELAQHHIQCKEEWLGTFFEASVDQ